MKRETKEGFVYDYAKLEVAGLSSLLHVSVQCVCVCEREKEEKDRKNTVERKREVIN